MIGRPFTSAPGKPAFGTFYESQNAGSYIESKRKKTMYCFPTLCARTKSQGDLLTLRYANYQAKTACFNSFNKANLQVNLITKLDIPGVPVITAKFPGQARTVLNYTIDPDGILFGNSTCGLTNYTKYLVYDKPTFVK